MKKIILLFSLVFLSVLTYSHSGRTDSSGCHKSKQYGYHCHGSSKPTTVSTPTISATKTTSSAKKKEESKKRNCSILEVIDGNTIKIKCNDDRMTVTLFGIKVPTVEDKYGKEAKRFLEKSLKDRAGYSSCEVEFKDKKDSISSVIIYKSPNIINEEMLSNGYAEYQETKNDKNINKKYSDLNSKAKEEKKGIWKKTT